MFVAMVGNWRDGFKFAWQLRDPEPEGPGLTWRETGADYWSGSAGSQPRGTVMLESSTGRWVAYVRLEDPPGLSPITAVGPVRHRGGGAGGDGRGLGSSVTGPGGASASGERCSVLLSRIS
jgi:hypothetical protein